MIKTLFKILLIIIMFPLALIVGACAAMDD